MKLPVISLLILGAQALAANAAGGDIRAKVAIFASYYAGLDANDGQFHAERLLIGYGPWVVKHFAMKVARPRVHGLPVSLS